MVRLKRLLHHWWPLLAPPPSVQALLSSLRCVNGVLILGIFLHGFGITPFHAGSCTLLSPNWGCAHDQWLALNLPVKASLPCASVWEVLDSFTSLGSSGNLEVYIAVGKWPCSFGFGCVFCKWDTNSYMDSSYCFSSSTVDFNIPPPTGPSSPREGLASLV